jgi:kinesin family protein 20
MNFSLPLSVISNSFHDMREQLNDLLLVNTEGKGSVFSTWVSFAEIYNEKLYDLLQPVGSGQKRKNLALSIDNKGQVYIKGSTFVIN